MMCLWAKTPQWLQPVRCFVGLNMYPTNLEPPQKWRFFWGAYIDPGYIYGFKLLRLEGPRILRVATFSQEYDGFLKGPLLLLYSCPVIFGIHKFGDLQIYSIVIRDSTSSPRFQPESSSHTLGFGGVFWTPKNLLKIFFRVQTHTWKLFDKLGPKDSWLTLRQMMSFRGV